MDPDEEFDMMDDGASSIVVISRREEVEGEDEDLYAPNPNAQAASYQQRSELPQEFSHTERSAIEERPGEYEGLHELHPSPAPQVLAAVSASPRQTRDHDDPNVWTQDTSPDPSADHEESAETAWTPGDEKPRGQKPPEADDEDDEYNEDGVSDIQLPPFTPSDTPSSGHSPAQSLEQAEEKQGPDREKTPGHESPRPSSEEEEEEGGQHGTADIDPSQRPPVDTPPRGQFPAQGVNQSPSDGGNMRSHHSEIPSPGCKSTESVHPPAEEDDVRKQTMTTPPQGSTPSHGGPQPPPYMTPHDQPPPYGSLRSQPPGVWPAQLQGSAYSFGDATPPRGPTPTQGQPSFFHPPGHQGPTPEVVGAGQLPTKHGFQPDSANQPPPRGVTPTWPSHYVDPRYFHGFPPEYSVPPGQSPVQGQSMGGQQPGWDWQQMAAYGYPYPPPHGFPGPWPVQHPQYPPPTQTPPPLQRPSPVKPVPAGKPGGPSRGPGKQGASPLTKRTAALGMKTARKRQSDSDEDDIRPEDSISNIGVSREQMSMAEKFQTWRRDKPEPLPDPGHRVLQVKPLPDSVSEDDVADFFEHKKRGGFDVENVDIDRRTRTALVVFKDPSGVEAVLQTGPHAMGKVQLNLAVHSPGLEQQKQEEEDSDSEHRRILHVTGLAASTDEEDVADYFEHKKRGGFDVEKVELRPQSSSALVYFRSAAAVEAVLQRGPFEIRKQRVEARPYSPEQTEEGGCILQVSGFPEDMDKDDVADFFENKKRGGFEVSKVEVDEETETALVYFDDPAALEVILRKAPFTLRKNKISVKAYVPEKEIDARLVLHVTGLPEDVDEDDLADFFENKKRGGFRVSNVDLDEKTQSAKVHFEDVSAVGVILQKAPFKMQKTQIEVKQYVPPKKKDYNRMLLVRGLPSNADDDDVADFFENKRRGGHTVEQVDFFPKQRTAVVYFEKSEAISSILGKAPFKMSSRELDLCKCTAKALKTVVQMDESTQEEEDKDQEETQEEEPCFVLQVADLPDSVSQETLTNFFENRKTSGGCEVSRVELNTSSKTALVYFEDPKAVETVLQRAPFLINKKKVSVSAYVAAVASAAQGKGPGRAGEEEAESCMVAVRGYGKVAMDTMEMYFENTKKSGGQDVQNCTEDEKKEVVYITFKSPQVAKRVSEKTDHTLGGRGLTVSLHKARPTCPDRVLLTGLPIQVSRENLINFLEARTKLTPKDILFGEEEGTALVVFDKDYDMTTLEKALKQRKLEGSEVKARPVAVSDAVLVKCVPPSVTRDTLELYFDNTRKSGGEGVQRVEKLGEGTWLVTFADCQVATKVSERSHRLGSVNLQVSLYVDCLGAGGGDRDPCSFSLPPPLSVPVPHPLLLRFLRESPSQAQAFKATLAQRHAQARLDDVTALRVTCTLTRETPQGKRLAKTWTEDVQTAVTDFLGGLKISDVQMIAIVFAEVEKAKKTFQPPAEKAVVFSEPASSTFVVIGEPKVVEQTSKVIGDLKKQQESELEKKKQTVTETISLKKCQLKYLEATKFLSDMGKQKGLKIDVDVQANTVVFTGLFNHVKDTQLKMFEFVQGLKSDKIKISKSRCAFLQKNSVESYVLGRLREKKLVAVWELADRELALWAASDQDVVQAAHVIKAAVQERTLNLDPESVDLLSSKEWSDLVKRTQDQDGRVLVVVDKARAEVVVTAVDDRMAAALEDVRNFFTENAVYRQKLSFPPGRGRFMTEHLGDKIHELETNNRAYHVSITFSKRSSDFKLEGTKVGLARVVDGLTALGASIAEEKHTLDKVLGEFVNSNRGEDALKLVQSNSRCIIRRKPDPTDQPTVTGAGAPAGTSQTGIYRVGGSAILRVTQGDLTRLKVDAVVNAANDRLRHVGGLARAISDRAGQSLQKECDAYVRQHGPLREGEVMVSGAGNMTCKKVIHAVGPRYRDGQDGEEDRLKAAVQGSLKEAHSLGLTSIAMPAISCGVFGYPVKDATQVIVEAVVEFFRDHKSTSLREVVLCDNSPNTLTHFHQAAAKVLTPLNLDDMEDHESVGGKPTESGGAQPRDARVSSRDHRTSGGVGRARAVLGEMALQTVDVMVNTTSASLSLAQGAVSNSLLKAAGPELQYEVNARYPQGLPPGEHFVVTNAAKLQAQRVFHTSLPDWENGGKKFLRELLEKSVKEADSQGFSSIAFPALGTGVLGYPRDVVVRHFQEVASSLLPACRSLREIRVVIFPSDQASIKAFQSMMDGGGSTGASAYHTAPGMRRNSRLNRTFGKKTAPKPSKTAPQPKTAGERVHAFYINDVVLMVKMGDLVEEDVDAIVNSTNSRIDLRNGAVANSILKKCGQKLVDECNKSKKQNSMKTKGLAVTSSHGLNSRKIIHVDGDFFKGQWTDAIKACLVKASKDNLARLAFPALGTGNRSQKPEDSAMAFIDAIKDMKKSQDKMVKEVRVVIYQPEMFAAFAGTIQKVMTTPEAKGWLTKMMKYLTGEMSPDGAGATGREGHASVDTSVTLFLFSDRSAEIQQALDQIRRMYDNNITKQEIQHETIKKFSEHEETMIKNLEEAFKVQAIVDKGRGVVELKGLSQGVIQAGNEVHRIIRDLEQERHLEEGAEVVSNYVQWCFLDESDATSQRREYDKKTNAMLEKEFKKESPFTKITDDDGFVYVFNFNDMEEYPEENPEDKVKLLRRDLLQKGYHQPAPEHWAHMKDDEELMVVPLASTDAEYVKVEQEFRQTLNRNNITVTKIERIQNRTLHDQYLAKKQAMEKQNPSGIQNERKLWHGTAENAIVSINHYGFNRSYCGKNAVVYGNGVYFAVNSNYSTHGTYSPADKNGDRHIFYVRVLTGEFTSGKRDMRVPPAKQGHVLYDSVVNNEKNPEMYIVFNDTQAYPDYLITFR